MSWCYFGTSDQIQRKYVTKSLSSLVLQWKGQTSFYQWSQVGEEADLSPWEPSALQHLARPSLWSQKVICGSGCQRVNYLYGNDHSGTIHSDLGPPLGHWPSKNPVPGWSWKQLTRNPESFLTQQRCWARSGPREVWTILVREDRIISPVPLG